MVPSVSYCLRGTDGGGLEDVEESESESVKFWLGI
jgi:hypothetical protein